MSFEVVEATSGRMGLNELQQWTPDCVIADLGLGDISGVDVIRAIAADLAPRPPVVAVAANLTVSDAVEAMKSGAKDVVEKPIQTDRLKQMITSAIDQSELARDMARVESAVPNAIGADVLMSDSSQLRSAIERVDRLASVEMPVLIVGERGTGTATLARRLHSSGPRKDRPFIVVPAGETPASVEAALFGSNGRQSAFAQAADGTVFIESLCSLGPAGQERLARVLAEVSAARASGQPVACPRIVVASERELGADVAAGRLREDLAHRLSPLSVQVPPLRERRGDIPPLVKKIVARVAEQLGRPAVIVPGDVMEQLSEREWLGNADELHSAVVRGLMLARDGKLRFEDVVGPRAVLGGAVAPALREDGWRPTADENGGVRRFDDYEAEIFRFALEKAGGCVSRAAETLGVGRATMYRKMRSYDIAAPPVSERAIVRTGRRSKGKDEEFLGDRAA
jgi:two-component system response regulator HydG